MNKIAIFVDVQNIYYTTRQSYGRQFDYKKLWQRISNEGKIVYAYAYAIHRGDDQQIKFQDALKHIGFTVKLKPFIQPTILKRIYQTIGIALLFFAAAMIYFTI